MEEINGIIGSPQTYSRITVKDSLPLHKEWGSISKAYRLDFKVPATEPFRVRLSNALHEEVVIGFDPEKNRFYTDRRAANTIPFKDNFPSRQLAPRLSQADEISITLLVDVASVELFADEGLTVMTDIFFPNEDFQQLTFFSEGEIVLSDVVFSPVN